jgi:hypothetical protein
VNRGSEVRLVCQPFCHLSIAAAYTHIIGKSLIPLQSFKRRSQRVGRHFFGQILLAVEVDIIYYNLILQRISYSGTLITRSCKFIL